MKTYLVLEDYRSHGHAWRETDRHYPRERLIDDLLGGHINEPARVLELDPDVKVRGHLVWCVDVSSVIARELIREAHVRDCQLPVCIRDFVDRHYAAEAA